MAGVEAGAVPEGDAAVQPGVVVVLVSLDDAGPGGDGVRAGGEGRRRRRPHALPLRSLCSRHLRARRLHRLEDRRSFPQRRRPLRAAAAAAAVKSHANNLY